MRRTLEQAVKPALTPLIDIAFLVLIFFMSLPFQRLDGKLEAHLPKQGSSWSKDVPPREIVHLAIDRSEGRYVFRLGQHRADSPWKLVPVLRKLGKDFAYEIAAGESIPWSEVVRFVDVFKGLRYKHLQFKGTRIPPPELRRLFRLPKPPDR